MFALYFTGSDGARTFITTVDDQASALSMARLLSRQDPREVVVIENRPVGDTQLVAAFRRGAVVDAAAPPSLPAHGAGDVTGCCEPQ